MKQYQKYLGLIVLLGILLNGCFRLDSNLFNPDSSITEYKFEAFDDWLETGPAYTVDDSMIHLFTLLSQGEDEADPTTIYAAYIGDTQQIATDTVILYLHGNAAHMDVYYHRAKLLAHLGGKHRFGLMMIDYRGYGLSDGIPSEEGLYNDADAALKWLQSHGLTGDRLAMYGFSMGTAPATELTANPRTLTPNWLLLEAPFASAEVMVQDGSGLTMPGSFFTNLKIDNAEEIKKVNQPFFWIHGINDNFLRITTHGEVVWKNYHGVRGVAVRVPGADHSTIPEFTGVDGYVQDVEDFFWP
ncbi:MAG: alpha/beta fold hydrolase [Bacteroidia bacterium]|nr:alpha/beta fold hydrolase [Bacteroidia bacterium]